MAHRRKWSLGVANGRAALLARRAHVHRANAGGIRDEIDSDDAATFDSELEYHRRLATRRVNGGNVVVNHGQTCSRGATVEEMSDGVLTTKLRRNREGAPSLFAHRYGCGVSAQRDVRIEHRQEASQIAGTRGGEKGGDHLLLARAVGFVDWTTALHSTARATGELTRGF